MVKKLLDNLPLVNYNYLKKEKNMIHGEKIVKYMRENDLTVELLSFYTDISINEIQNSINYDDDLSEDNAKKLAQFMKIDVNELVYALPLWQESPRHQRMQKSGLRFD